MDIFKELLHALWQQDFETLSDPSLVWTIYLLVFVILFWRTAYCPPPFYPATVY
ncbi:Inner membrane protein YqjA [Sodalis praecaptivus]